MRPRQQAAAPACRPGAAPAARARTAGHPPGAAKKTVTFSGPARDEGHGLDAVAVEVAHEGRVVAAGPMFAQARRTVRTSAGGECRFMERVDCGRVPRAHANVDA